MQLSLVVPQQLDMDQFITMQKLNKKKIRVHFGSTAFPLVKKDKEDVRISYKGKKVEKHLIVIADGVGSIWKKTIFREIKTRRISQSAY